MQNVLNAPEYASYFKSETPSAPDALWHAVAGWEGKKQVLKV